MNNTTDSRRLGVLAHHCLSPVVRRWASTPTLLGCLLVLLSGFAQVCTAADPADFDKLVRPLLVSNCIKCHGEKAEKGKVNFKQITSADQLLANPKLIQRAIEALDANDMPPDTEPALKAADRAHLLGGLKTMLHESATAHLAKRLPIRRLNRFQYNNSVKDLFQLKLEVFELPEKLMTRHDDYLRSSSGKMPDKVRASSLSLHPRPGMREVHSFPKDLRADHGYDNQADQLTLSPLLLDTFLRLSASIVDSPDFNEGNVGIWKDFFQKPADGADLTAEVRHRLEPFMSIAFREPVDEQTLNRYVNYTVAKIKQGATFTESMKKVASAVLVSPMFLYRASAADGRESQFALASNLSFFLWSSCPDMELLRLAKSGDLSKPDVLNATITRMLADPKIERFLDSFPSQWMKLEGVFGATPDPQINPFFSLDPLHFAGSQMVVEPLLLFDAVFVEDRPIIELISPKFSYQSDFLKTWYTSDLTPPPVDMAQIREEDRRNPEKRKNLEAKEQATQAELNDLFQSIRHRLQADAEKSTGGKKVKIASKILLEKMSPAEKAKYQPLAREISAIKIQLDQIPPARNLEMAQKEAMARFENALRNKMSSDTFERVPASDPRYGGVITNAAVMSMTSGPKRTHPIARGAWIIEVIFNDPPAPPPNNVPPLNEEADKKELTIREKFAAHRENPSCAGCHSKLDPLGFALENYDITGRWRAKYDNGRQVDSSGTLLRKYEFDGVVRFKESLVKENRRFAKAFTGHLLRFALGRELTPADALAIEKIVSEAEKDNFRVKSLIRDIAISDTLRSSN